MGIFNGASSNIPAEKAFLVGVTLPVVRREEELENLQELEALARTAGAAVVGQTIQNRTRIEGSTYIGKGKIEEIARIIHEKDVNLVIFDGDLTPAQARNIENSLDVNVVDRTELILDIFARRARTRQAKIQVEIAQLTYALPRLRRLWEHLSRQEGGIGTRGPGETQIEVDRRKARDRMAHLTKELEAIHRGVEERRKKRANLFNVTLVGYTNAGKSTLLNRIAGSNVLESDRLFSTLDSTTRRAKSPGGGIFLLTDTIGFIRKLPPHLVASFKATLLDVREADLILHVVDITSSRFQMHIEAVNETLNEILGGPRNSIMVFNKIDSLNERGVTRAMASQHPDARFVSARTGEGLDDLRRAIHGYAEASGTKHHGRYPGTIRNRRETAV